MGLIPLIQKSLQDNRIEENLIEHMKLFTKCYLEENVTVADATVSISHPDDNSSLCNISVLLKDNSENNTDNPLKGIVLLQDRNFQVGDTVLHFKGGLYTILAIGTHTETNERMVVYQSLKDQKIWIRPYDMFISKVDKEKYPDVVQPYRLIKVKITQED